MKNPLTPAGMEPPTFRFVARHLNQCATAVAILKRSRLKMEKMPCSKLNIPDDAVRNQFRFIVATSRQHRRYIIPQAVNTV